MPSTKQPPRDATGAGEAPLPPSLGNVHDEIERYVAILTDLGRFSLDLGQHRLEEMSQAEQSENIDRLVALADELSNQIHRSSPSEWIANLALWLGLDLDEDD